MYERTYHAKVLTQKTAQEKKPRRRFPFKKVLWLFLGALVIAGIVVLIKLPSLQIREIEVVGTKVADPEDVSLFVESQIEGNTLYVFPRTSMLLVPTATIAKRIKAQFPRFSAVDVRRMGLHGLSVTVVEREGAFLWCAEEEDCFFMTDEGIVFAPAPFFSGDAYERIYYGEERALPFSPLPTTLFFVLQTLRERLPTIGIAPVEYRFISDHQLDIYFSHHSDSALLLIDQTNDLEKTLEDLATALMTEPLKGLFHNEGKPLEYLDARFANKVVYKFK